LFTLDHHGRFIHTRAWQQENRALLGGLANQWAVRGDDELNIWKMAAKPSANSFLPSGVRVARETYRLDWKKVPN